MAVPIMPEPIMAGDCRGGCSGPAASMPGSCRFHSINRCTLPCAAGWSRRSDSSSTADVHPQLSSSFILAPYRRPLSYHAFQRRICSLVSSDAVALERSGFCEATLGRFSNAAWRTFVRESPSS